MNKVIILHGFNGTPKVHKWLKSELENKGYDVFMPEFPPREGVVYKDWKKILNKYKGFFNDETILVAHSIGNEFIIKYLKENMLKAKGYVGLAAFGEYYELEGREDLSRAAKDFLINEEEIEYFKNNVLQRFSIYSDNDHIVPFELLERFPKIIDSKSLLIKGLGHMGSKSGVESIPELLEIIINME